MLDIDTLSVISFTNTFSHSACCLFCFVDGYICFVKSFKFNQVSFLLLFLLPQKTDPKKILLQFSNCGSLQLPTSGWGWILRKLVWIPKSWYQSAGGLDWFLGGPRVGACPLVGEAESQNDWPWDLGVPEQVSVHWWGWVQVPVPIKLQGGF